MVPLLFVLASVSSRAQNRTPRRRKSNLSIALYLLQNYAAIACVLASLQDYLGVSCAVHAFESESVRKLNVPTTSSPALDLALASTRNFRAALRFLLRLLLNF